MTDNEINPRPSSKKKTGHLPARVLRRLAAIFVAIPFFVVSVPGASQEMLGIAATVNDEMISVLDLNNRLSLAVRFSGLPDNQQTRSRLAPQILRALITERLRMQEAKRLEVNVSKADLDRGMRSIERQNGLQRGELDAFLNSRNLNRAALEEQVEANLVWGKVVAARFRGAVRVGEEEIDAALQQIEQNVGKPEFRVYEIFLPADSKEAETRSLNIANRLVQQLRAGARFTAIARNFSQNPSAATGGDLGWSAASQLGGELVGVIQAMKPGDVTGPVRTQDGIYILFLRDRRISKGLNPDPILIEPAKVNLFQVHFPADQSAAAKAGEASSVSGCSAIEEYSKSAGTDLSGNLGTMRVDQLSDQMKGLIKGLPVGKASRPLTTDGGTIVLMVCKRFEAKYKKAAPADPRSMIHERLMAERLELAARRYMRDLQRAAFIDIRL